MAFCEWHVSNNVIKNSLISLKICEKNTTFEAVCHVKSQEMS